MSWGLVLLAFRGQDVFEYLVYVSFDLFIFMAWGQDTKHTAKRNHKWASERLSQRDFNVFRTEIKATYLFLITLIEEGDMKYFPIGRTTSNRLTFLFSRYKGT